MQIHQSAEDYLETILMLSQRMGKVRSIDVVNELGFTKASVSIAMKKLRENGYIAVDGEGNLTLLEPGLEIAQRIYSRHRLLTHFFVQLGVTSRPPPRMPARQSTSSASRRWKRSAKAPCATTPPIRRQSKLISKDTGTPKDVPVFLLFIAKKIVPQMPFAFMAFPVKNAIPERPQTLRYCSI